MRISSWILVIGSIILVTGLIITAGIFLSWWFLWIYLMMVGLAGFIFLIYFIATRNKVDEGNVKPIKLDFDGCMQILKTELLREEWADMLREVSNKSISKVGREGGVLTPIATIKFRGEYEPKPYHFYINLNDAKEYVVLYDPTPEEILEAKNRLSDNPSYIETVEEEMGLDDFHRPVKRIKRLRETQQHKEQREDEKAEEEAESL